MSSKIVEFTSHLRKINGLYLFKIFTKYTCITDIDRLFNHLAEKEKEADLRQLERLWDLFIKTGSINMFRKNVPGPENNDHGNHDQDDLDNRS
jgi:hypothetical protein